MNHINLQRNKTKQARLSSLLLLSMGAALFTFASKTSIVSINYAKVNSSNLSGLEHSLCFYARGHHQEKGKDGLFSSLLRISLLFLIVLVSVKSNRLLQAREIRRIDFSAAFSYPLRLSTELKKRQRQILKARLKGQPCFAKYNRINLNFKDKVNFPC